MKKSSLTFPLIALGGLTILAISSRPKTANGAAPVNGVRAYGLGFSADGRIETFPIDSASHEHVEGVAYEMLEAAITDERVEALAEHILSKNGLDFTPNMDAAVALHAYVNDTMPTMPDPPSKEHMTDPGTIAAQILGGEGMPTHFDCDDKAMLLSALARSVGFQSTICFMDVDGDGTVDHAMSLIDVLGHGVMFAETTIPGKSLGWRPDFAYAECLAL